MDWKVDMNGMAQALTDQGMEWKGNMKYSMEGMNGMKYLNGMDGLEWNEWNGNGMEWNGMEWRPPQEEMEGWNGSEGRNWNGMDKPWWQRVPNHQAKEVATPEVSETTGTPTILPRLRDDASRSGHLRPG